MTADSNVDDEVDAFLDKIAREYKDGWTEENWEEEMEKHPFFMTKMPENEDEISPAVEGSSLTIESSCFRTFNHSIF